MDERTKATAIELVRRVLASDFGSEADEDAALLEVQRLLPDPHVLNLIFWPDMHPLSAGLNESDLDAERIVDLALRYEPFSG